MLNGLYVATSGLLAQENRVNSLSNNLANINTTGYKKEKPVFTMYLPRDKRYPQNIIRESLYNKSINSVVRLDDIYTDFQTGTLKETTNPYDLALGNENAFFVVDTPFGLRFTRDGNFTLNNEGVLVNQDGYPVLSSDYINNPEIVIPNDANVTFTEQGEVLIDNLLQNRLYIVSFNNLHNLQKVGRNMYQATNILPEEAENPELKQGFLESSNVNPVGEMVKMIDSLRSFERYQKAIDILDGANDIASNRLGRIS
ncbi:MAG: flagellar hook-basal body protein [Deferribacterota bacterium]|nr:flagellar hook-basal body protein [Deferribacterota bacterium]